MTECDACTRCNSKSNLYCKYNLTSCGWCPTMNKCLDFKNESQCSTILRTDCNNNNFFNAKLIFGSILIVMFGSLCAGAGIGGNLMTCLITFIKKKKIFIYKKLHLILKIMKKK